jgi:hypothetical protein
MSRQEYGDKLRQAMICDCDRYGHPHSPAGGIERFRIRIERKCVNGLSTDRFGHVCRSKVAVVRESLAVHPNRQFAAKQVCGDAAFAHDQDTVGGCALFVRGRKP